MTAATASSDVEEKLKDAFVGLRTNKSVRSYNLRFTMDGKEFTTLFHIMTLDHPLTNGCISIGKNLASSISSNSPEKGCFTPTLSKDTLPAGVSQTDMLQTLSTKLKFAVSPDSPVMTISDVARLVNPATGEKYPSSISLWRLLRGEFTLYEKYGYTSPELDVMRARIGAATWRDVKGFSIFGREPLEAFVAREYPGHFEDDKLITESMKEISYEEANRVTVRHALPALGYVTIINLLATALGLKGGLPGLSVYRDSPIWRRWDARLLFLSFEEVTGARGGARRRTRRRKTRRRKSRKQH